MLTSTAEPAGGAVAEPGLPPGYDAVAMRPPVAVRDGAVPSEKTGVVVSGTVARVVVEPTKRDTGGSSTVDTSGEPLAERLVRLKELLAAGALTQQEYEGKRDEIMEEVGL